MSYIGIGEQVSQPASILLCKLGKEEKAQLMMCPCQRDMGSTMDLFIVSLLCLSMLDIGSSSFWI